MCFIRYPVWEELTFCSLKRASGGPAGGQTFEKFDKQLVKKLFRPKPNGFQVPSWPC